MMGSKKCIVAFYCFSVCINGSICHNENQFSTFDSVFNPSQQCTWSHCYMLVLGMISTHYSLEEAQLAKKRNGFEGVRISDCTWCRMLFLVSCFLVPNSTREGWSAPKHLLMQSNKGNHLPFIIILATFDVLFHPSRLWLWMLCCYYNNVSRKIKKRKKVYLMITFLLLVVNQESNNAGQSQKLESLLSQPYNTNKKFLS